MEKQIIFIKLMHYITFDLLVDSKNTFLADSEQICWYFLFGQVQNPVRSIFSFVGSGSCPN
jgi:hypothetical protein